MILLGILRPDIDIQGRTCYNTTEVNKETYQEWLRDRPYETTATCLWQGAKSGGRAAFFLCLLQRPKERLKLDNTKKQTGGNYEQKIIHI